MKKYLYLALAATTLAACSDVEDLSSGQQGGTSNVIGFQVQGNNSVTRAIKLQEAGHYNFGVFAYKSTDKVNNVMSNYLVGYFDEDEDKGYQKTGSTVGDNNDAVVDGKSHWMYENMGNTQYHGTYAGGALDRFYASNNAVQYIKYWDKSAPSTCFYAYAPYVGSETTSKRVTYVDGTAQDATGGDTYVMNIPNGTLEAGYDDATKYEYMYASKKVSSADYGHDVSLEFKRLVAKVNIKFWEDVPGYKVQILDLKKGRYEGVQAAASVKQKGAGEYGYRGGKYYTSNGVKIKFDNATGSMDGIKQYRGTFVDNTVPLVFKSPTNAAIGENRFDASASPTTYYAIPKGSTADVLKNTTMAPDYDDTGNQIAPHADLAKTGFTFHVTYMLTAEDSGERITVHNATVHVPYDYCKWEMNKHYTYIFKITQGTNGSTDNTTTIDPKDPEVPTTPALYPIVFDNCVVADWDEDESEWNITDDTALNYHNITLSTYSLVSGDITVTINDGDKHNGHSVDYSAVKVYGPNSESADVTSMYDAVAKKITVTNTTAAGLYTVVYTCPDADINGNHPKTWKAYFVVGNDYDVTTSHDFIGCNGEEPSAKLAIKATKDGGAYTPEAGQLKIEYPTNYSGDKDLVKVDGTDVVVDKDAVPGVYKLVLTINEGSAVKVAEKTFEVKDYSFILSPSVVYSRGTNMEIVCSQWNNELINSETSTNYQGYTTTLPAANLVSLVDNKITVKNGTTEGTYYVTYTVWKDVGDVAKVTYKKTFEVRNTHEVSVPAQQLVRNVGTSKPSDYSTALVDIKVKFNGNAPTSSVRGNLSVVKADKTTATTAGDFDITEVTGDNGTYKLTCKAGVTPGTYYVKYVSTVAGGDKAEYGMFIVK